MTGAMPSPLILLCGLTNTPELWAGMRQRLGSDIVTKAPRLPVDTDVDAIARTLLGDAPARFHLCGYSFGGYIALAILAAAPHRVDSLTLLCSTPRADGKEQIAQRRRTIERIQSGDYHAIIAEQDRWMFHPENKANAALIDLRNTMANDYGPTAMTAHLMASMSRPDRSAGLLGHHPRVMMIAADNDVLFSVESQRRIAADIQADRFEVIERAGHGAPLERPEAIARILNQWIRGDS